MKESAQCIVALSERSVAKEDSFPAYNGRKALLCLGEHLGGAGISEFLHHCSSHLPAFSVGLYSVSPEDT